MEFQKTVEAVAASLNARVLPGQPDRSCILEVPLREDRHQRVTVSWDGEAVRCRTQCSCLIKDDSELNLFRFLLEKNHELLVVAFALDPQGAVELVWSQTAQHCSPEQLALALTNLAAAGDHMEKTFSGPELDRF